MERLRAPDIPPKGSLIGGPAKGRRAIFGLLVILGLLVTGCVTPVPGDMPEGLLPSATPTVVPEPRPVLALNPSDRILVLAPHPDDETISSGGLIQQARALGLPVHIVFLTNGDNNEWSFVLYRGAVSLDPATVLEGGLTREHEALNAAAVLGLTPNDVTFLGYPDFGTLEIWQSHWLNRPPFRAMMTERNAVPYTAALRPGAAYTGENILADLTTVIENFKPTKVIIPHPGDQNPDHQALYLFTRVALWNMHGKLDPEIYTYLVHYGRFPWPRGLHKDLTLEPPANFDVGDSWLVLPLTPEQVDRKLAALKQHKTQYEASTVYLESFVRRNELFSTLSEDYSLTSSTPQAVNSGMAFGGPRSPLDQLRPSDLRKYVNTEVQWIRLDGDALVVSEVFLQPLPQNVSATASLFGYRDDRPFAEMPKLRVDISARGYTVSSMGKTLKDTSLQVTFSDRSAEIRVPLALLGNPQRVLLGLHVRMGRIPLDADPWRSIDLAGK